MVWGFFKKRGEGEAGPLCPASGDDWHDFQPRYDKGYSENGTHYVERYVHDICVDCGATVARKTENAPTLDSAVS